MSRKSDFINFKYGAALLTSSFNPENEMNLHISDNGGDSIEKVGAAMLIIDLLLPGRLTAGADANVADHFYESDRRLLPGDNVTAGFPSFEKAFGMFYYRWFKLEQGR